MTVVTNDWQRLWGPYSYKIWCGFVCHEYISAHRDYFLGTFWWCVINKARDATDKDRSKQTSIDQLMYLTSVVWLFWSLFANFSQIVIKVHWINRMPGHQLYLICTCSEDWINCDARMTLVGLWGYFHTCAGWHCPGIRLLNCDNISGRISELWSPGYCIDIVWSCQQHVWSHQLCSGRSLLSVWMLTLMHFCAELSAAFRQETITKITKIRGNILPNPPQNLDFVQKGRSMARPWLRPFRGQIIRGLLAIFCSFHQRERHGVCLLLGRTNTTEQLFSEKIIFGTHRT